MKKLNLIILTTVLIISSTTIAQKIAVGPEIGINLINMEKTDVGTNYQLGLHAGASAKYYFTEKFAVSSGLFVSQKKKQYSFIDTTVTADPLAGLLGGLGGLGGSSNTSNEAEVYHTTTGVVTELYLQLPVLANYEVNNINFYAGPYASVLLSANRKEVTVTESTATDVSSFLPGGLGALGGLLQPASNDPETSTSSSKEGLATIDFGATAGIGYRVDKLNFNLFYSYGFMDYREDKGNESTDTHQIIQFSIAYLFNIGGSKGLKDRYDLDVK